jgi:signal transduction histidine kinase
VTVVAATRRVEPSSMRPEPAELVRRVTTRPLVVDVGLALVAFGVGFLGFFDGPRGDRPPDGVAVVLLAVSAAALVRRRINPLGVWAATSLLTVAVVLLGGTEEWLAAPMLVALYTVGRSTGLRTTAACVLTSGVVYAVTLAIVENAWLDERGDSPALPVLALAGAAAAVGFAVRSQQDALRSARERARQAEHTREEEAVRRVTDERLRIARELHDVVAHHISVINVQAGVARHLMESRPEQARAALTAVRDASKTVITEMASVLGLLRTEDGGNPAEPAPGLSRLPALVASVRSAGLDVAWRTTGEIADLPPIADLAAYRVIQESLTNAVKYGTGTAELVIHHESREVVAEVRNPIAAASGAAPSGGHGLIGMRERLEAVSGSLSAGPDGTGTWLVRAVVPRVPQ